MGNRIWRTPGQKSVSMSIEGVFTDSNLKNAALSASNIMFTDVDVYDGTTTLTGDFIITAFSNTAEMADAVRFSATLQSSGAIVVVNRERFRGRKLSGDPDEYVIPSNKIMGLIEVDRVGYPYQ